MSAFASLSFELKLIEHPDTPNHMFVCIKKEEELYFLPTLPRWFWRKWNVCNLPRVKERNGKIILPREPLIYIQEKATIDEIQLATWLRQNYGEIVDYLEAVNNGYCKYMVITHNMIMCCLKK